MTAVRAFEFMERVSANTDPADISDALFAEAAALGFEGIAMGWLPPAESEHQMKYQVVGLPEEYFRRYSEQRYDRHSAVVKHLKVAATPFRWERLPVSDNIDPMGRKILSEAWDFGIRSGWSLPVHRDGILAGFVTVSSSAQVKGSPDLLQFHIMTLCAHARIADLHRGAGQANPMLAFQERDILSWMSTGASIDEASEIMGVSSRTATGHLRNAAAKLGTSNSVQTIVEAVRRGLIAP